MQQPPEPPANPCVARPEPAAQLERADQFPHAAMTPGRSLPYPAHAEQISVVSAMPLDESVAKSNWTGLRNRPTPLHARHSRDSATTTNSLLRGL